MLALLAVCLAISAFGLVLDGLTPRGVVHGRMQMCNWGGSPCEAFPRAKLIFLRASDNSRFTAVADSRGYYSIVLRAGHYTTPMFVDGGPLELNVIPDRQVEADYEIWRLPQ